MPPLPAVDDLRLAVAVADTGSVGQAAVALRIAQPSASQRLALLERRLGLTLFDRGPTGTRPSAAGAAFVADARRILDLLDHAVGNARAAGARAELAAGTIASLAPAVFGALDAFAGPALAVRQRTDHGPRLIEGLADGVLDLAVLALPPGTTAPPGLSRTVFGADTLALLLPDGVPEPGPGRRGYSGRVVTLSTYTGEAERIGDRLAARGATVIPAASAATALTIARRRGVPAVVPRSAVLDGVRPGERIVPPGVTIRIPLSLIVPKRPDPRLAGLAEVLRAELGLARAKP